MIISHKHKFIFIKTAKTAGTSIESYLAQFCGENDVIAPHGYVQGLNYEGLFNPIPELLYNSFKNRIIHYNILRAMKESGHKFIRRKKFDAHMPAILVKSRIPDSIWNNYFKFTIERNPWDKVISHYYQKNHVFLENTLTFEDFMSDRRHYLFPFNYNKYTDWRGNLIVDYLGYYENLYEDMKRITETIGIPFDEEKFPKHRSNTRKYRDYRRFFSKDGMQKYRDMIEEAYCKEIEMHGYRF